MKTLFVLALIGQCYARPAAVQRYNYATTYAAPSYNYNQQVYAVPYVEKVKFVAVENQPSYDYYAALAAAASRSYERFQEYGAQQQPQPAITYSIPSSQPTPQQPVYQVQVPVKTAPVPQQQIYHPDVVPVPVPTPVPPPVQVAPPPVQATPQQPVYSAPVPVKGTPQQPVYGVPSKTSPPSLQQPGAPAKNPSSDEDVPRPIIPQKPLDYSTSMEGRGIDIPPPPPVPAPPTTYNNSEPTIQSVNTAFLSVLTKNCASCHTGQKSKGDFPIFDYPGRLAALTERDLQNIFGQVASNKMPYKRHMSAADRQALLGMLSGNISSMVSR